VYASNALADDDATRFLLDNLDGEALAEPRQLRFTTGRRRQFWAGNCVALGLAAGFLEPLESTAIHLVQTGIAKLLALFPDRRFSTIEIDEYNRLMTSTYEQVRDFLVMHYRLTERDDSEFWRHCRNLPVPDALQHKLDLFESSGRCFRYEDDLFAVPSWVAVLLGQGIEPRRYDEIVNSIGDEELVTMLEKMRRTIADTAKKMPLQRDYLARLGSAAQR
jgi:tryptophan halogenase